ncbi:UNVERIFIED_CONTAM: hypothetical protein GTU68_041482 [Idotea baltica]|nr:hypothetical protein [Idotea baltica]
MCGVIGVVGVESSNQIIFDGLTMLQHRGQDAAGIMTCTDSNIFLKKGKGLVVDVIKSSHMSFLRGCMGIGHVRYPTAGSDSQLESQPFFVNSPYGVGLAHNGNLVNTSIIKKELVEKDLKHVNTSSDSELLLNVLSAELGKGCTPHENFCKNILFRAISSVFRRCLGGYAVVGIIVGQGFFAFRDPKGIRPLTLGVKKSSRNQYIISSETVAFEWDGYRLVNDIQPGEVLFIDSCNKIHLKLCHNQAILNTCMFEYVYLARPDSFIDGVSVYNARLEMGYRIALKITKVYRKKDIDVVMPIPDSGRQSALALAHGLGVKYCEGFIKNRYVGRTFIMSTQKKRTNSIKRKLNIIPQEFTNKHVLLVDDSIVRGNTSKLIISMCRKANTRVLSLVSTSPVVKYPNIYGIDMPTHKELIGSSKNISDIARWIGVDYLYYLNLCDLIKSICSVSSKIKQFETSVFDGNYITGKLVN